MTPPSAIPQPPPIDGGQTVLPLVLERLSKNLDFDIALRRDLEARAEMGRAKYGTYLQTNNGRDALIDLQQEALDVVMYAAQWLFEVDEHEGDPQEYGMRRFVLNQTLDYARMITRQVMQRQATIDLLKIFPDLASSAKSTIF
jgi:hypothetical protein